MHSFFQASKKESKVAGEITAALIYSETALQKMNIKVEFKKLDKLGEKVIEAAKKLCEVQIDDEEIAPLVEAFQHNLNSYIIYCDSENSLLNLLYTKTKNCLKIENYKEIEKELKGLGPGLEAFLVDEIATKKQSIINDARNQIDANVKTRSETLTKNISPTADTKEKTNQRLPPP